MSLDQILSYNLKNKNVCIIGSPASGKTWLSKQLDKGNHRVIHTDQFIPHGYVGSLYALLDDVVNTIGFSMVEGVQGYRLLRKGFEQGSYRADVVIECEISTAKMNEIYRNERDPEKIKYLRNFNAGHQKVLNEFLMMCPKEQLPVFLNFQNEY